jgi:hypothetical protein
MKKLFFRRSIQAVTVLSTVAAVVALPLAFQARPVPEQLPARLSDSEFWRLASEFSEPDGTFHSENLVSNEQQFQAVIPQLLQTAVPGRAYVGVGSEQNFTYIGALRPTIAFILDIRRGNLDLHLAYKALFELSADRAEFVSRLFSRPRPPGLTVSSTAQEIFAAYANAEPSQKLYEKNLGDIRAQLVTRHGFKLSNGDLQGLEFVYSSWFRYGPNIRYQLTTGNGRGGNIAQGGGGGNFPNYASLMTASDGAGKNRSYLASEDTFRFLKDLETRNMIMPVVGNFGGPKALRAVGAYLRQKETVVSVFYASNVEQYLREDGIWDNFCASAATLPIDAASIFIRSERGGFRGQPGQRANPVAGGFASSLAPMKTDLARCATK